MSENIVYCDINWNSGKHSTYAKGLYIYIYTHTFMDFCIFSSVPLSHINTEEVENHSNLIKLLTQSDQTIISFE